MRRTGAGGRTDGDGLVVVAAFLTLATGVALRLHPAVTAGLLAAVPFVAFALLRYVPGRGAVAGTLALGLGGTLIAPGGSLVELAMLAGAATSAVIAGRGISQVVGAATERPGRWAKVVVVRGSASGERSRSRLRREAVEVA